MLASSLLRSYNALRFNRLWKDAMKKKKIINVIEIDGRDARFQSGIERYLSILSAQMPEHIKTTRIIFYWSPEFKDLTIKQNEDEISVYHPTGFPGVALFEAVIAYISPRLSQMENLIVKSNCLGFEGLAYNIRARFYAKTVGVLHCLPHRARGSNGQFPPNNAFFNMDHVILVCEHGREFLDGVKNKQPHSVIYNGIDIPKVNLKAKPKDGVFRFLFAHGWGGHKGMERIIPAIKKVAETHKIEVIVVGGFAPDDKIFEKIEGLPITKVGLLENPEDIKKYYEMCDCALFASYSEACSFAGIEAMAYDMPIISSDAAGLVEMFGKAAIIVPSNEQGELDADEYARQMIRVMETPSLRTKLGILAYARYKERYTAKKMAHDTIQLYESLLGM